MIASTPGRFLYARIVSVKIALKSLIVWLLLLAVPFQGFASATMLVCAPMQSSAGAAAAPHDHRAMLAAQAMSQDHGHHAAHAAATAGHGDSTDHPSAGHSKCNSCAACCFGAAMPPPDSARMPVDIQNFALAPLDSGFVPAVDLAFPERPPKTSLS